MLDDRVFRGGMPLLQMLEPFIGNASFPLGIAQGPRNGTSAIRIHHNQMVKEAPCMNLTDGFLRRIVRELLQVFSNGSVIGLIDFLLRFLSLPGRYFTTGGLIEIL